VNKQKGRKKEGFGSGRVAVKTKTGKETIRITGGLRVPNCLPKKGDSSPLHRAYLPAGRGLSDDRGLTSGPEHTPDKVRRIQRRQRGEAYPEQIKNQRELKRGDI